LRPSITDQWPFDKAPVRLAYGELLQPYALLEAERALGDLRSGPGERRRGPARRV